MDVFDRAGAAGKLAVIQTYPQHARDKQLQQLQQQFQQQMQNQQQHHQQQQKQQQSQVSGAQQQQQQPSNEQMINYGHQLRECLTSIYSDQRTRAHADELLAEATIHSAQNFTSITDQSAANQTHEFATTAAATTDEPQPIGRLFESGRLNLSSIAERLPAIETDEWTLEALSADWQSLLVVIYSVTAITSFVLNAVTVIVLARGKRSELRKYLINLSMSDLLMSLLSIPFTYTEYMLGRWVFASFLCPVVRCAVLLSVCVSVATMVVIGINRHLAIMYPLKRKTCTKLGRWTIRQAHVIGAIWLLGLAISTPEYLMNSAQPFCYNRQLYFECRSQWAASTQNKYTVFLFATTFVIPLSLLSYLYTSMGFKLWRRQCPGNVDVNRDLSMQGKRVKCIKMLLVVVVLFAVFWLPLQTFNMALFLFPEFRSGIEFQSTHYLIFIGTYFVSHWLSMAHSCLNPLIYCFMNDKFRSDLNELICGLSKRNELRLFASKTGDKSPSSVVTAAGCQLTSLASGASGGQGRSSTRRLLERSVSMFASGSAAMAGSSSEQQQRQQLVELHSSGQQATNNSSNCAAELGNGCAPSEAVQPNDWPRAAITKGRKSAHRLENGARKLRWAAQWSGHCSKAAGRGACGSANRAELVSRLSVRAEPVAEAEEEPSSARSSDEVAEV